MVKRFFLITVIAVLVLAALPVTVGAQDDGPERSGIRPDAPPYGIRGPYPVGFALHTIVDDNERLLNAHIWYPALNPDAAEDTVEYLLPYFPDGVFGHALLGAAPDLDHGPYPLVIFAHGWYGQRLNSPYLCEHLASYGFVAISVAYQDNMAVAEQPTYPSMISRPADVSRQIDYAEQLTADGDWAGLIDTENIGVAGHSLGGYTALAAGGARLDWDSFGALCADHPEYDPLGFCGLLLGYTGDMATLAGWDAVPDSPWPSLGDPRVDVVVPLAPAAQFFGTSGMVDIAVPVLMLGGTADTMVVPEPSFFQPYSAITAPKTLVRFAGGGHMLFFYGCDDAPWMIPYGAFWACSDPVWDMDRAHDLIDHFVTAFFLAELYGDEDAAAALAPDAVAFPGITYETTAY
ncbi:MAG: hypothetical protein GYB65_02775 [Chloroflexi bacterium]|nr:hypothetical protein [Chloroflexota bacterium]